MNKGSVNVLFQCGAADVLLDFVTIRHTESLYHMKHSEIGAVKCNG